MTELIWTTKSNSKNSSEADVSISINKNGNNKSQFSFRFRNNSFLRFTKNEFVEFAVTGARIYFRESNVKEGFKLSTKTQNNKNCGFKTVKDLNKFIGDYELLWDSQLRLNYIDLNKKINYKEAN